MSAFTWIQFSVVVFAFYINLFIFVCVCAYVCTYVRDHLSQPIIIANAFGCCLLVQHTLSFSERECVVLFVLHHHPNYRVCVDFIKKYFSGYFTAINRLLVDWIPHWKRLILILAMLVYMCVCVRVRLVIAFK